MAHRNGLSPDACPDGRDGLRPPGEAPALAASKIESRERDDGADIYRSQARKEVFRTIEEVAEMPNLIEVQKASYDQFLLVKEPVGGRPDEGLQAVFKSVFPI